MTFHEYRTARSYAMQPPWYKEKMNWVLIVLYALIMALAVWFLLNDPYYHDEDEVPDERGALLDVPFPGAKRAIPQ